MIVLHALWREAALWLWGEAPVRDEPEKPKRGRKATPKPLDAPRSAYDAGADALAEALRSLGGPLDPSRATPSEATLWLPTVSGKPVASSRLIDPEVPGKKVALQPWRVTALALSPADAVDLLCQTQEKDILAAGVVAGSDLRYWGRALRFAGALMANERFVPSVSVRDGAYRAVWKPMYTGIDTAELARLAGRMPEACRAWADGRDAAEAPSREGVLRSFIDTAVDRLVRATRPVAAAESAPAKPTAKGRKKPAAPALAFDSIHDQWLHALHTPEGVLAGDAGELSSFARQLAEWTKPLSIEADAPVRFCFRLEEPSEEEDPWRVRYLLQAADDPSLLVAVPEAWKAKGRVAAQFKKREVSPREFVLRSLGRAAGLCPPVESSLKTGVPEGFDVDAAGALQFLTEQASALESAGYGVLLPAWWTRKGTKKRLSLRAHVKSPKFTGGAGLSLDSLVAFDWQAALGDELLSPAELEALARLKSPLVQVRGQWVHVDAKDIQDALAFLKRQNQTGTVRDVMRMALGADAGTDGLEISGVEATGWIRDLLQKLDGRARLEEIEPPEGFRGTLRPYQARGLSWLSFMRQWGLGACLADDMGLGKTVQALALILRDWQAQKKPRPVLLICPTSVIGNWQKEAKRFAPDLPVMIHHGSARAKDGSFAKAAGRHALVISSYALLHRDQQLFSKVPWAGVVVDEAQNIKNAQAKQAQAARALEADYRIALTGTPVENNVGDLWSLMEFLNPGLLGSQAGFRRSFFIPIQAYRDPEATARLKRLTGPFVLRRLKTDKSIIADLPDKMEMKVFCTLTQEQASLYAAVVKELENDLGSGAEGIQRKGIVLATLSKLKQVCNHPAQFLGDNSPVPGRSGKLARLTEMIDEVLAVGEKALIFSQFAEMGGILQRHLEATFAEETLFLHGAVSKTKRDAMVARFQERDGPRLFVLSLKAGGTGLNLTQASHVFHFDRWWNPAVENQATDRAFRIGQTRNVQVHKYVCTGTFEERIDEMIEAKKALAEGIVGTGEAWLTELSTEELRDVFALRKEALGG